MDGGTVKCKNCGALLEISNAVDGVIECEYCFSKWTLPKKQTSPASLDFLRQGEHDLDTCRFDAAYSAYAKAAQYDSEEPEAYWGMALAEFKVQYIKDSVNNRLQPICHEFTDRKITENKNYLCALKYATAAQKREYEGRAQEIDYIRNEFLKIKQSGLDYDCFICVKVSAEGGQKTADSRDADFIYDHLKRNGFTPFYSEREIRGRTGADYEAMILYALYTSETMLVVCSDKSYLASPWVKNEYTRFKELVNDREKENDSLTIVYNGTPVEKLPGFNGKIQGIDFSRRDAISEIEKFVQTHTPLARAKREEEKRRKENENEELRKQIEELKKQLANANTGLSDDDLLERLERKRQEKENKAREEAERRAREDVAHKAREEAARRAKVEAERKAREDAERKALEYAVRKAREEDERRERERIEAESRAREAVRQQRIAQEKKIEAERLAKAEEIRQKQKARKNFEIEDRVLKKYIGNDSVVIVPDDVIKIADGAFHNCGNLQEIRISYKITSIGNSAFEGCFRLTSVVVQNKNNLGFNAFYGSTALTDIGERAFSGCRGLKNIIIPANVKSIKREAFNGCSGLKSITITNGVTTIDEYAFRGCSGLNNVTIPNSVLNIGEGAFTDCKNLTNITISDSVQNIGNRIFFGCEYNPILKCEAKSKPSGWDKDWNLKKDGLFKKRHKVIWGAK